MRKDYVYKTRYHYNIQFNKQLEVIYVQSLNRDIILKI